MKRSGMRGGRAAWRLSRISLSLHPGYAPRSHRFPIHNVKQRSLLRSGGALLSASFLLLSASLRIFRPE
jgi:hypothetical protein